MLRRNLMPRTKQRHKKFRSEENKPKTLKKMPVEILLENPSQLCLDQGLCVLSSDLSPGKALRLLRNILSWALSPLPGRLAYQTSIDFVHWSALSFATLHSFGSSKAYGDWPKGCVEERASLNVLALRFSILVWKIQSAWSSDWNEPTY